MAIEIADGQTKSTFVDGSIGERSRLLQLLTHKLGNLLSNVTEQVECLSADHLKPLPQDIFELGNLTELEKGLQRDF